MTGRITTEGAGPGRNHGDVSVSRRVPFENVFAASLGFLVPLQHFRLGELNLTAFDIAVFAVFSVYAVLNVFCSLPLFYYVGAFMLLSFGTLAAMVSDYPNLALPILLQWYFVFIIVVPTVYTSVVRGKTSYLIAGLLGSSLLLSIYSVLLFSVGDEFFIGGRYAGFMGDPQATAFIVSVCLPFLYVGLFRQEPREVAMVVSLAKKVLCALAALIFAWILFRTASRTGFAALGLGVLSCFLYQRFVLGRGGFSLVLVGVFFVLALFTVDIGFLYGIADDIDSPLAKLVQRVLLTLQGDTRVGGRLELLQGAVSEIDVRSFFVGVGFENYVAVSGFAKKPHNLFLVMLVEGGIGCLLGLLVVLASVVVKQKRPVADAEERYILMVVAASVSVLVIFMLNTQGINRIYWFVFSLALFYLNPNRTRQVQ